MANADPQPTVTWRAPRRRREVQFEDKREAILRAAAVMFREKGFEAASLNDLAEVLKVTKPTIYYYVESKDRLLLEIKRRAQEQLLSFMRESVAENDTGYAKLRAIMVEWAHTMISDYGACLTLIQERALEKSSQKIIQEGTEEIAAVIQKVLDEGQRDGSLVVPDPVVAGHTLFGSLNWIAAWYNPAGRIPADRLIDMQVDMLLNGIRGPSAKSKAD